jgi:hypothetical protein
MYLSWEGHWKISRQSSEEIFEGAFSGAHAQAQQPHLQKQMRQAQTNPMLLELYPHHSHRCGARTFSPVDPTLSGKGLLSETKPQPSQTKLLAQFQSLSQRQFLGGGLIP